MFINRKYSNRHRILGALQKKMNESYRPDAIDSNEFELSWNELAEASGLSDKQIQEQIDFLILAEEVKDNEVNFNSCYMIRRKGTTSFYDRKYLDIGRKEFKDNLYDVLKLLSGVVLLLIAVISFARNILVTEKNNREIEQLKNDVSVLKSQIAKKKP